jgi:hypothetical protein
MRIRYRTVSALVTLILSRCRKLCQQATAVGYAQRSGEARCDQLVETTNRRFRQITSLVVTMEFFSGCRWVRVSREERIYSV